MKYAYFFKAITFSFFSFLSIRSIAQNNLLGGWNIATLNYHINQKFVLYGEVQVRSQKVLDDFFYHELKTGISYNLPNKDAVFVGFGNYGTYTFPGNFKKPVTVNENRIWEQFVLVNNIGRIKFEHRYRIEQRWLNGQFNNRFRYRLNPIIPINHSSITNNTLFASVFDEVFFTNKAPYFLRNRIFGGAGYQFNKLFTLQIGFIRQYDYRKSDDGSGKNFIQTSLIFNAGKTNSAMQHHNADMD